MTPCGKKARWAVIEQGIPYPVCRGHGDDKKFKAAGMKFRKAKKGETCGQSVMVGQACAKAMEMISQGKPPKDIWAAYMKKLREDP